MSARCVMNVNCHFVILLESVIWGSVVLDFDSYCRGRWLRRSTRGSSSTCALETAAMGAWYGLWKTWALLLRSAKDPV